MNNVNKIREYIGNKKTLSIINANGNGIYIYINIRLDILNMFVIIGIKTYNEVY